MRCTLGTKNNLICTIEIRKICKLYIRNKKTVRFVQEKQENNVIWTVETKNFVICTVETRKQCDLSSRNKNYVICIQQKQENNVICTVLETRKLYELYNRYK